MGKPFGETCPSCGRYFFPWVAVAKMARSMFLVLGGSTLIASLVTSIIATGAGVSGDVYSSPRWVYYVLFSIFGLLLAVFSYVAGLTHSDS